MAQVGLEEGLGFAVGGGIFMASCHRVHWGGVGWGVYKGYCAGPGLLNSSKAVAHCCQTQCMPAAQAAAPPTRQPP